jgi:hypothetical protein
MRLARYILVAVTGVIAAAAPAASADLLQLPSIESESVSHVTASDATLEAEVNLHEVPAGAYYQFQIVTDPSEYGTEIVCPSTRPQTFDGCVGPQEPGALPIGFLPGNSAEPGAALSASLDLASAGVTLKPDTTYHYRVLVARRVQTEDTIQWEPPTVYGADRTFTTPPAPAIEGESISNLSSTDATLAATINDEGLEAAYEFYLVTAPMCLTASPPCERPQFLFSTPVGTLLASGVGQSVSVDLNDVGITLSPGERYEYWVTAVSATGTTQGQLQAFTAPADMIQPQNTAPPPTKDSGGSQSSTSSSAVTPAGPPLECLCDCARGCHAVQGSAGHLSRRQKLTAALAACARKPKRRRSACAKRAYKKYGRTVKKTGARA